VFRQITEMLIEIDQQYGTVADVTEGHLFMAVFGCECNQDKLRNSNSGKNMQAL